MHPDEGEFLLRGDASTLRWQLPGGGLATRPVFGRDAFDRPGPRRGCRGIPRLSSRLARDATYHQVESLRRQPWRADPAAAALPSFPTLRSSADYGCGRCRSLGRFNKTEGRQEEFSIENSDGGLSPCQGLGGS